MQTKSCSECGMPAEVSLCQIVSTVGRAPRWQRCSTSTAFCAACFEARVKLLRGVGLRGIHEPLSEAFTALANACELKLTHGKRSAPTTANGGGR
jgi:hypothetical protein